MCVGVVVEGGAKSISHDVICLTYPRKKPSGVDALSHIPKEKTLGCRRSVSHTQGKKHRA